MSDIFDHDRGPLQTFEITWKTGHVERIQAHQVSWHGNSGMFDAIGSALGVETRKQQDPSVVFHAELEGRWTLVLRALEEDIRTIRNCLTEDMDVQVWSQGEKGSES